MDTTVVSDTSKPAPTFARVYFADSLGRCMYTAFDQFRSRKAAAAYWWMMSRQGVTAFLPDENNFGQSNSHLRRDDEPAELKRAIDQCEAEYLEEGACFDEGADFANACSIFCAARGLHA